MLLQKIKNKLAFTMIELLIVIAIIAILASIIIPQFVKIKDSNKTEIIVQEEVVKENDSAKKVEKEVEKKLEFPKL